MKYISPKRQSEIDHRVRHSFLKRTRKKEPRPKSHILLPQNINFTTDYNDTTEKLDNFKSELLERSKSDVIRGVNIDLIPVQKISIAGALVLASEMERWKELKKIKLIPYHIFKWNKDVKGLLSSIGFFKLLGVYSKSFEVLEDRNESIIIPIYSSNELIGEEIFSIIEKIDNNEKLLEKILNLMYPALLEASYNSIKHAYPHPNEMRFEPITRFWITASIYRKESVLRFFAFD